MNISQLLEGKGRATFDGKKYFGEQERTIELVKRELDIAKGNRSELDAQIERLEEELFGMTGERSRLVLYLGKCMKTEYIKPMQILKPTAKELDLYRQKIEERFMEYVKIAGAGPSPFEPWNAEYASNLPETFIGVDLSDSQDKTAYSTVLRRMPPQQMPVDDDTKAFFADIWRGKATISTKREPLLTVEKMRALRERLTNDPFFAPTFIDDISEERQQLMQNGNCPNHLPSLCGCSRAKRCCICGKG